MPLTNAQIRHLRGLAHHLNPVVQIGANRVTAALIVKVGVELDNHELVKIRVLDAERDEVFEARDILLAETGATLVHLIGHTLVLFRRRNRDPLIHIPGYQGPNPPREVAEPPRRRHRSKTAGVPGRPKLGGPKARRKFGSPKPGSGGKPAASKSSKKPGRSGPKRRG